MTEPSPADGTLALIGEAYAILTTGCPPGIPCGAHKVHHATGMLLAALHNRADTMLDAGPPGFGGPDNVETFLHANIPGWRAAVALALIVTGREPTPWQRVGQQIKSDHWAQFNRGEWGTIVGTITLAVSADRNDPAAPVTDRLCYSIQWPDGGTDQWATIDPDAAYQYREPQ